MEVYDWSDLRHPARKKIEQLTADLTAMLQAQPDVQPDGVTIALDKFNDYSIDLACRVYITKVNLREFMQVKNTLNLQILDLMKGGRLRVCLPDDDGGFAGEEVRLWAATTAKASPSGKLSPQAADEG